MNGTSFNHLSIKEITGELSIDNCNIQTLLVEGSIISELKIWDTSLANCDFANLSIDHALIRNLSVGKAKKDGIKGLKISQFKAKKI